MAGAVRQAIDVRSLSNYLETQLPEIQLPISLKQFGYGQSNPTYQVTAADGQKYVLRKKPPGKLLSKTAHQVEREYRIIHALGPTDVPVPKAYCLCEDASVIGTPFYIMEFLDGRIFEDPSFPGVNARERSDMWHDAVRTIAKMHRVNPDSVGLSTFGKHSGFYTRQLRTFSTISTSQARVVDVEDGHLVGDIPHFEDIVAFLQNPHTQPKDRSSLVHGDYKIDNLVYHRTEPKVIGILESVAFLATSRKRAEILAADMLNSWEMSTIGHPLSDLSNLLSPYSFAVNPPNSAMTPRTNDAFKVSAHTPGLPSRAQCAHWYAEVAGWHPAHELDWGDTFANFRNSVIMQGIAARYAQRQASSEMAKEVGSLMGPYGDFTWGLAERLMRKESLRAKM